MFLMSWFPRTTMTVSPLQTLALRTPYFSRSSLLRCAESIFLFTCADALAWFFLWTLALLLAISHTSHDSVGCRGHTGPPLGCLPCDGAFDVCSLGLSGLGGDDRRVVLEVDHGSVGPPHGAPLADDDGEDDLPPHLRGSLRDRCDDEISDSCGGDPPGDTVV